MKRKKAHEVGSDGAKCKNGRTCIFLSEICELHMLQKTGLKNKLTERLVNHYFFVNLWSVCFPSRPLFGCSRPLRLELNHELNRTGSRVDRPTLPLAPDILPYLVGQNLFYVFGRAIFFALSESQKFSG
jgi:hypothetical protein